MRIFAGSDFHVDYQENLAWFEDVSRQDFKDDVLIVAGDVANSLDLFSRFMTMMSERFAKVLFVPGNHDLWCRHGGRRSRSGSSLAEESSSFEQLETVLAICKGLGVSMSPYRAGRRLIVPLFGWYDYSFGEPNATLLQIWMDYRRCDWQGLSDAEVSAHLDSFNHQPDLTGVSSVLSFSHFLPRIDLMPERLPEKYKFLFPVFGSQRLEAHIRSLGSSLHIYGHSHLNRRVVKHGVTYINNAFGYPSEKHIAQRMLMEITDLS
ncbi:metallophosphoesterase [Allorhizobium sp. BGMRC 0089]|uniref:metallophosphoesterase n=1 Tax=Allorhizobium sonneratiae TaxID=2934936 RepID=UPI002033CC80|nr:metallophosphoesterase [Allorhizobium sonneratiae]MCM2293001.1 metallophosphoesterase [Allorhizobium sonneratiae]